MTTMEKAVLHKGQHVRVDSVALGREVDGYIIEFLGDDGAEPMARVRLAQPILQGGDKKATERMVFPLSRIRDYDAPSPVVVGRPPESQPLTQDVTLSGAHFATADEAEKPAQSPLTGRIRIWQCKKCGAVKAVPAGKTVQAVAMAHARGECSKRDVEKTRAANKANGQRLHASRKPKAADHVGDVNNVVAAPGHAEPPAAAADAEAATTMAVLTDLLAASVARKHEAEVTVMEATAALARAEADVAALDRALELYRAWKGTSAPTGGPQ